jgi:hypothetical protein
MTLVEAKAAVLRQLDLDCKRGPQTLIAICERLGVRRNRSGRFSKKAFSKKAYALYTLYGRALQALKRNGAVIYLDKAEGGPGWMVACYLALVEAARQSEA